MPAVLRSLANRRLWAGLTGLALSATAAAQPPDDPIAASNRLSDPWVAARQAPTPADTPWLATSEPRGKVLPSRIVAARPPEDRPVRVSWQAAVRQPITPTMPVPDRPMMPCEPAVAPPGPTVKPTPPPEPLPPPRPMTPEDVPAPPPVTAAGAVPTDEPPARKITTIRFLDEPPPKPAAADGVLMAMIRRGGAATGTAAEIRAAVEKVCRPSAADCQTEVAGERQVRVLLTVRSTEDWQKLYERMQELRELGEYGLIFQVRVGN